MFSIGFVASKMIEKFHNALFIDDDILFFDEDSENVTFSSTEAGMLHVDLNNINLDNANFIMLIFMSSLWLGIIDLNNAKH